MWHITSIQDGEASWRLRGLQIAIESYTDYHSRTPAYRMRMDGSIIEIPGAAPGVVYFGEAGQRPDLPLVRAWFPHHDPLWQAVHDAYWDTISPQSHPRLDTRIAYDYTTNAWPTPEPHEAPSSTRDPE